MESSPGGIPSHFHDFSAAFRNQFEDTGGSVLNVVLRVSSFEGHDPQTLLSSATTLPLAKSDRSRHERRSMLVLHPIRCKTAKGLRVESGS